MIYHIADLFINIIGYNECLEEKSQSFLYKNSDKNPQDCDMQISIELQNNIMPPEGDEVLSGNESVILKKRYPEQGYHVFLKDYEIRGGEERKIGMIDSNLTWNDVKLRYIKNDGKFASRDDGSLVKWIDFHSFLSAGVAFRNFLIKKHGIQIHCSSIEFENKGVIFSAPSGTGKSTHTRLWQELYGDKVTIINEDRPAIRYINNTPMICGTPWSGTSNNFANKIVPLNTIVMLEQARVNSIELLDVTNALQMLMPRCFLPYFDSESMEEALETLENLVKDIPVYRLKCRPDYEAVELVKKCLK